MNRLLCAIFGHQWKRTGVQHQHTTSIGVAVWGYEYQCRRCTARMWE